MSNATNGRYVMSSYRKDVKARVKHARTIYVQYKKPIVFLEGDSDWRFFQRLLVDKATLQVMGDKSNVLCAIDECRALIKDHYNMKQFAFGIVDMDYDRILGIREYDSAWVVYVDRFADGGASRDLDVMLFRSSALSELLARNNIEEDQQFVIDSLVRAGSIIGATDVYRLKLSDDDIKLIGSFKELDFSKFFDPQSLTVDIDKFIAYKFAPVLASPRSAMTIKEKILSIVQCHRATELARGHDLTKMLAIYLHYKNPHIDLRHSVIERALCQEFDISSVWTQQLGNLLSESIERTSYKVL
jgi:hypothetical protein